ncbi:MAG: hypothetical protein M1814_001423 [Vezdaea aestivalis]|nr:MAG: hypothetical protein M1814_001423 [Vezdaea aestivalis]
MSPAAFATLPLQSSSTFVTPRKRALQEHCEGFALEHSLNKVVQVEQGRDLPTMGPENPVPVHQREGLNENNIQQKDSPKILSMAPDNIGTTTSTKLGSQPELSGLAPTSTGEPAPKRRKMTPAQERKEKERTEKEKEKVEKEEQKAKQKAEALAEKQKVQEEKKRQQDEIREKKRQAIEDAKKAKEEEKRSKLEEKRSAEEAKQKVKAEAQAKEQKKQPRMTSFFAKSVESTKSERGSPPSPTPGRTALLTSREKVRASPSVPAKSEYEEAFLPFAVKPYMTLAPFQYFESNSAHDTQALDRAIAKQNFAISKRALPRDFTLPTRPYCPSRKANLTVKQIMSNVQGFSSKPTDTLNEDREHKESMKIAKQLLDGISRKLLKFSEDLRPPYQGTRTKVPSPDFLSNLARRPHDKKNPDLDYEHDSEAEWVEPEEEGEDIGSDDEEESDDDSGEDMADFLDDEEAPTVQKQTISQNDEPIFSGLCWEGPDGKLVGKADSFPYRQEISDCRMEPIAAANVGPIDPYSTIYWEKPMKPPKRPLQVKNLLSGNAQKIQSLAPITNNAARKASSANILNGELLEQFKAAVNGKDDTKIGLIEFLKKTFPTVKKGSIKETLEAVATRQGPGYGKKWILNDDL